MLKVHVEYPMCRGRVLDRNPKRRRLEYAGQFAATFVHMGNLVKTSRNADNKGKAKKGKYLSYEFNNVTYYSY